MADGEARPDNSGQDAAVRDVRSAPAKVNLYLHVVGRREDGFHLLDSLIVFAGIGDAVMVTLADSLTLEVDGPHADGVPTGPGNLVMRAATALAEATGIRAGAHIRLTKRLPAAAGIGGGSSDAAAVLAALVALWGVTPDPHELAHLALKLGADVPVCLAGAPSFVGGVGEEIEPAPALPPTWLVLANPGVEVPTASVFAARSGDFSAPRRFAEVIGGAHGLAAILAERSNDLTDAACSLEPVIGDALAVLAAEEGCLLARMSGSGATCFGLFDEASAAGAAARRLAAAHPAWWVEAAPILP